MMARTLRTSRAVPDVRIDIARGEEKKHAAKNGSCLADSRLHDHINIISTLCIAADTSIADFDLMKYFDGWYGVAFFGLPSVLSVIPTTLGRCFKWCCGKKNTAEANESLSENEEKNLEEKIEAIGRRFTRVKAEAEGIKAQITQAQSKVVEEAITSDVETLKPISLNSQLALQMELELIEKVIANLQQLNDLIISVHEEILKIEAAKEDFGSCNTFSNFFYLGIRLARALMILSRMYEFASDKAEEDLSFYGNMIYNIIANLYMITLLLNPYIHPYLKKLKNYFKKPGEPESPVPVSAVSATLFSQTREIQQQLAIEMSRHEELKASLLPQSAKGSVNGF